MVKSNKRNQTTKDKGNPSTTVNTRASIDGSIRSFTALILFKRWWPISLLSILMFLVGVAVSVFYLDFKTFIQLSRESGPIENATAAFFLIACICMGMVAWKNRVNNAVNAVGPLLMALFFFICFGEEISWGYHFFKFQAPYFFNDYNIQTETNLHNLVWVEGWTVLAFNLVYFGFFIVLPIGMRMFKQLKTILNHVGIPCPPLLLTSLVAFTTLSFYYFDTVPFSDMTLQHKLAAFKELSQALFFMIFAARELLKDNLPMLLGPIIIAVAILFMFEPYALTTNSNTVQGKLVYKAGNSSEQTIQSVDHLQKDDLLSALTLDGAAFNVLKTCQITMKQGSLVKISDFENNSSIRKLSLDLIHGNIWICSAPNRTDQMIRVSCGSIQVTTGIGSFGISRESDLVSIVWGSGRVEVEAGDESFLWHPQATEGVNNEKLLVCQENETCIGTQADLSMTRTIDTIKESNKSFVNRLIKVEFAFHSELIRQAEKEMKLPAGSLAMQQDRPGRFKESEDYLGRYIQKFPKFNYAAMRSSTAAREFTAELPGAEKSISKLLSRAASVTALRTSEKAKCLRPSTACRRVGVFSLRLA